MMGNILVNQFLSARSSTIPAFLLILIYLFTIGCEDKRVQTVSWFEFEPVYISEAEFISSVELIAPRDLVDPGKIYFYDDFLFVNEINEGVHIIDNSNPALPVNVGFINIPANKDIAVRGTYLYADSNSDLLVFNIQDLNNPQLVSRTEGVFSNWSEIYLGFPYQRIDPSKGIVVDWKEVKISETCESNDCYIYNPRFGIWGTIDFANDRVLFSGSENRSPSVNGTGQGGSMARFAISGDYLYAVDNSDLVTLDISSFTPSLNNKQNVGWRIETIFPSQGHLFIGSQFAMYIYSIANQTSPSLTSVYNHLTACDPVVVQGNYAYVTLRDGSVCQRGVNRLEVIDIQDISNPREVAFYAMQNPHGLGIDGDYLFVSEGESGIKIMDAIDPLNMKLIRHITDIKTFDVIPFNDVLMVTGATGIVQYDYSDINNIMHLSTIPVTITAE
ncbi:MAG: LVIVD repeat-containing protein [Balneola sp.]